MEAEFVGDGNGNGKVNFEVNPDRLAVQQRLEKLRPGESVTYKELSALIGYDVRERRHILEAAKRWLLNNKEMVFGAVTGVGVQRLTDEKIANLPEAELKSLRKRMRRVLRKVGCIQNYAALSQEAQDSHNVGIAYLSAYRRMAAPKQVEKVRKACVEAKQALPSGKMLEIFR